MKARKFMSPFSGFSNFVPILLVVGFFFISGCEVQNSFSGDKAMIGGSAQWSKVMSTLNKNSCFQCHAAWSNYNSDSDFLSGDIGPTFSAGHAQDSDFYQRVENGNMPPPGNPRMSASDVAIIKAWIDAMQPVGN